MKKSEIDEIRTRTMGSSTNTKRASPACPKLDLSLTGMHSISATCEVTNRIDIDKYFQHLKDECAKYEKPKSPRRVLRKTVSSSMIEFSSGLASPVSPGRKKRSKNDKKKRRSVDVTSLVSSKNSAGLSSPRQTAAYFNYDIEQGKVVEASNHNDIDCIVSRQKSWDLSLSKQRSKNMSSDEEEEEDDESDLAASYSAGDFKDMLDNKNKVVRSASTNYLDNIGERHRESAMNYGKIYSVSEQNRRSRRKYFHKIRKSSNDRKKKTDENNNSNDNGERIDDVNQLVQKLHLHEN